MTPPSGRRNSVGPEAFPLRPLAHASSTHVSSPPTPSTPPPAARSGSGTKSSDPHLFPDLFSSDSPSASAPHGTFDLGAETLGAETADQRPDTSPGGMTSSNPPSLRSTPSFTGPSYGAISPGTTSPGAAPPGPAETTGPHHHGPATRIPPRDPEEQHPAPPRMASKPSRDSLAGVGVLRSRRSARFSEDLTAGPTAMGGLEGRFGAADPGVPPELIDDADGESEDSSRAGLLDDDEDSDGDGDDGDEQEPPDNSPYPQVRASVPPTDDTSLSINTPRMWTFSVLFSVLGSAINLFFSLRYPSVAITPVVALLLVHPLGRSWDYLLKRSDDPPETFVDGSRAPSPLPPAPGSAARRLRLWLAQGRWNEKEHSCVYVSSNVSFGFAFATDVIVEQTKFYGQHVSISYQLLLTLSSQILGYAFAGLTRRFLVRPSGMIWPGTLMSAAMFSTLHGEETKTSADGWRLSRGKFFYLVWTGSFLFYFLPGLLAPALSYFSVVTWFAPDNVVVANLFGVVSGLGLFPVTFDWAQIAYIGSPLLTPFWAAMNVVAGLVVVMWILAPIAYYANWLYSAYMPILSAAVFDNTGAVYDVRRILTDDFLLDREAYQSYSRVFLPITYVLSYAVQFAGLAALLVHTACWHGRDIWTQWKRSLGDGATREEPATPLYRPVSHGDRDESPDHAAKRKKKKASAAPPPENLMGREDVHNRLMRRYRDAPTLWYLATLASTTAVGIFVVEYYPVHLPWYGLLLALAIGGLLFVPIGIIMAVTNQHSSIYLVCQLVCGAVFPGRPVANMVFVTYGYISSAQGIKFAADLKLGHYMKIPPRLLFAVQVAATAVASLTQIGVLNWMFARVPALCEPGAPGGFTCPLARVHFNGSILWGVVGPSEFFGVGATYRPLVWAFVAGALLPVPLWLYGRRPGGGFWRRIARKVNLPVLFGSLGWIPPATGLNFSVWALACYLLNHVARRRAPAWWARYTMPLSAALDSGLAVGVVVVFFGFVYPGLSRGLRWWGTEVYKAGCDWNACPYLAVPEGGRFGPDTW